MRDVMDRLAKRTVKDLLSELKALNLTNMYEEIFEEVSAGQPTQHQNRQAHSFVPSATGSHQPKGDLYQPSDTSKSVDSYLNIDKQAKEEKKGDRYKLSSSSLTENKYPIECTSLRSDFGPLDVNRDQENKLKKFNEEKNETTIIGNSSPDDNSSVKATPTYLHQRSNELEMEPGFYYYQPDENNLDINESNPVTSTAEKMSDVAPPNADSMNERADSDNAKKYNPGLKTTVTILGICSFAFLVSRYLRR